MLKIVEATFTDAVFVSKERTETVAQDWMVNPPGTPGRRLAGLWADSVRELPTNGSTESEVYNSLETLYMVRGHSSTTGARHIKLTIW
jgi:hypothetical protein